MQKIIKKILTKILKHSVIELSNKKEKISEKLVIHLGHVYKYKPVKGKAYQYLLEIIENSLLYFPSPADLNDPEEGKPCLVIKDINDPVYRVQVEAWVRRCISQRIPYPTESEIQIELNGLTQKKVLSMVNKSSEEYQKAINLRYGILSLSKSPSNRHLWENYADNFNGVAIEFFIDSNFPPAYEMNYSDDDKLIDVTSLDDNEHLIQTVLVKREYWSQEKEVRIILGEPPINNSFTLINQKYKFQDKYLTGIMIGYRVKKEIRNEILKIVKTKNHLVRCYVTFPIPWGSKVLLLKL